MKIKFPKITVKLLKKMVLRALFLALLLVAVCALAALVMMACPVAFVFIPLPLDMKYMMQIVFAVVAFVFFVINAPDVCHWADKYV